MQLICRDRQLSLDEPLVMGVLNVTPDSFSDGGRFVDPEAAVAHALEMVEAGAAIIDVGGESTRPGTEPVPVDEELARVIPVIETLAARIDVVISIDTGKPEVMRAALVAGAAFINDVNALAADDAVSVAAASGAGICLMHMQGEPRTMQIEPHYDDVVEDVYRFLAGRVDACGSAGVAPDRITIDPGFGFGKTLEHNLQLLAALERFLDLGVAVLVGLSRKSMLGTLLDRPVDERLAGSVALAALAAERGAHIVRAHDVAATRDAVRLGHRLRTVKHEEI